MSDSDDEYPIESGPLKKSQLKKMSDIPNYSKYFGDIDPTIYIKKYINFFDDDYWKYRFAEKPDWIPIFTKGISNKLRFIIEV